MDGWVDKYQKEIKVLKHKDFHFVYIQLYPISNYLFNLCSSFFFIRSSFNRFFSASFICLLRSSSRLFLAKSLICKPIIFSCDKPKLYMRIKPEVAECSEINISLVMYITFKCPPAMAVWLSGLSYTLWYVS